MKQYFQASHYLPDSIPSSILEKAYSLVSKTAFLSGLLAPETAACVSTLLQVADAHYSSVIDRYPTEPEVLEQALELTTQQSTLCKTTELRRRIIAVLGLHHHLLLTTPSHEGNGALARMLTHHSFAELGLLPHLWSLSRGLSRRRDEYQSFISENAHTQGTGLEGGQQFEAVGALLFIDFMLDVCHEEVDYMSIALSRRRIREQVLQSFKTSQRIAGFGISPEIAPALIALLVQGSLPRTEFETFTGLRSDEISDQVCKLRILGIVDTSSEKSGWVEPRLPAWFAHEVLLI